MSWLRLELLPLLLVLVSWLRLDEGFTTHPKVLALSSDSVRWVWLRALEWAAKHHTDTLPEQGAIGVAIPGWTPSREREFCTPPHGFEAGLLELVDGRLLIHDWVKYQAKDPTAADRQRRHRALHHRDTSRVTDRDGDRDVSQRDSRTRIPSRPVSTLSPLSEQDMDRVLEGVPTRPDDDEGGDDLKIEDLERLTVAIEEVEQLAHRVGWGATKRAAALADPERAHAWLSYALGRSDVAHPGNFAWKCLQDAEAWPEAPVIPVDVAESCRRWLSSPNVDRMLDTEATIRDEFGRIARRCGQAELGEDVVAELIREWRVDSNKRKSSGGTPV